MKHWCGDIYKVTRNHCNTENVRLPTTGVTVLEIRIKSFAGQLRNFPHIKSPDSFDELSLHRLTEQRKT